MSGHIGSNLTGNVVKIQGYQHQADAVLAQANPTSTTLYTVLATTRDVRIISITVSVAWTVQPSPLEIVLTIDGQTLTFAFTNPVSATVYACIVSEQLAAANQVLIGAGTYERYRAFLLEGRSVLVQARTTGGTVQNLDARVKYARIP